MNKHSYSVKLSNMRTVRLPREKEVASHWWHTHRFTVVFVSGRHDLPSDARAVSLTTFQPSSFLLRLNKGSNFVQSAFWSWITKRFSLVRECNVFLQCCITPVPVRQTKFKQSRDNLENWGGWLNRVGRGSWVVGRGSWVVGRESRASTAS